MKQRSDPTIITVGTRPGFRTQGLVSIGGTTFPCALGRSGIRHSRREGDGATPAGDLPLLDVLYRPDRIARPGTGLPVHPLSPRDGWCDQPWDANYNRRVTTPYPASHETLWREDGLYDIVVILDWNFSSRRQGAGSAIFLHLARPGFTPTEGCVALCKPDMLALLSRLGPVGAILRIG